MKRQRGIAEILLLVLIVLAVANVFQYRAIQGLKTKLTVSENNLEQANRETKACNDSIDGLEAAAFKRGKQAEKNRAAAAAKADGLTLRAQKELSTPATVPGDDCRSAADRVFRVMTNRGKP